MKMVPVALSKHEVLIIRLALVKVNTHPIVLRDLGRKLANAGKRLEMDTKKVHQVTIS